MEENPNKYEITYSNHLEFEGRKLELKTNKKELEKRSDGKTTTIFI